MLAKTWKTILLAICIIAVLFNIISKLVRTPSFRRNLDAVLEENIVTVDESILKDYDFYHPYMWQRKLTPEIVDKFEDIEEGEKYWFNRGV